MKLMTTCSGTLECLEIGCEIYGTFSTGSIALAIYLNRHLQMNLHLAQSIPPKLRSSKVPCSGVPVLDVRPLTSEWLVVVPQTITPENQGRRQI